MINDPTVRGVGCKERLLCCGFGSRSDDSTYAGLCVPFVVPSVMTSCRKSLNARHSDDDRKIARELRSKSYSFQNLARVSQTQSSSSGFL
jgi:hypothetical protein